MRDHQHSACIFLKVVFEPIDAFSIQVVGWLVQQQDARLLDQQTGEGNTAFLAAR